MALADLSTNGGLLNPDQDRPEAWSGARGPGFGVVIGRLWNAPRTRHGAKWEYGVPLDTPANEK